MKFAVSQDFLIKNLFCVLAKIGFRVPIGERKEGHKL
jgi:hypothetical protein